MDETKFNKQDVSNIKLNSITSITGPFNIDILKSELFNCSIFLFSDVHVSTNNGFKDEDSGSLYLPLYLDALFKKYPNKQFDLIMEEPLYKYESIIKNPGLISSIGKQFEECYKGFNMKEECNNMYKNVRFHNIDIRFIFDEVDKGSFYEYIRDIEQVYETLSNIYDINEDNMNAIFVWIRESLYKLFENLKPNNLGHYILVEKMYRDEKFKRYKKLPNIGYLNTFTKNKLDNLTEVYDVFGILEQLGQLDSISLYELQAFCLRVNKFLLYLNACIVDHYSLIRFIKITLVYGSHNVIYIAGAEHIENFKNAIKTMDKNGCKIIKGKYEINDRLYATCNYIIESSKTKNYELYKFTKLKLDQMIYVMRRILNEVLKKENSELAIEVNNCIKILSNLEEMRYNHMMQIARNPNLRIVKINSSLIESNLGYSNSE